MTNFKHLTATELLAYSLGSLEKNESQTLGRHLLNCAECRKLLPMPSAERFWAIVMTDDDIKDVPQKEDSENFLSFLSSLLKLQSGLLWGSAALIIVFCFSFVLWLNSADSSREVVQTFENELGSQLSFPVPVQTPDKENSTSLTNSNRAEVVPTPKNSKAESPKPNISQNNSGQDSKKPTLKRPNETISATRGVSAKCGESNSVEIEFSADKENFVFKWKAVPKATKYHLYISDNEEILIDEFETETETSFVLKKTLDPQKTYKWKIIVTLENGQTVVGDSQKFTVNNLQSRQKKTGSRRNSAIRCSTNSLVEN
jgi:hypothetical protein